MKKSDFTKAELKEMTADLKKVGGDFALLQEIYKKSIVPVVAKGETTFYQRIGLQHGVPYERNLLGPYLEWMSRYTDKKYGFLVSVMVVHKGGDFEPGSGFYELAKGLGYKTRDKLAFMSEQVNQARNHYMAKRA